VGRKLKTIPVRQAKGRREVYPQEKKKRKKDSLGPSQNNAQMLKHNDGEKKKDGLPKDRNWGRSTTFWSGVLWGGR